MDKWTAEDFIDTITPEVVEDDPWADPMEGYQLSTSSDKEDQLIYKTISAPSIGDLANINADEPDEVALSDEEDWSDVEFVDSGWEDRTSPYNYLNGSEEIGWDEPEPEVEYDPDLREALHVVDYDTSDLARRLKINELVSSIEDATKIQKERIIDLLDRLSAGRLRSWSPWLREQQWTGHSMILFLEFREVWDSKREWWEYCFWSKRFECWWSNLNDNPLTLDETYYMIHRRIDCNPYEVVDENWLDDWDYFALYKRGFHSFAQFALYRASLKPDEDWKSDIGVRDDEFYEEEEIPYRHHSDGNTNGKWIVVWDGRGPISS